MRLIVAPDIKKKYWAPLLTWLLALFNSVNKQTDLLGDWTRFLSMGSGEDTGAGGHAGAGVGAEQGGEQEG